MQAVCPFLVLRKDIYCQLGNALLTAVCVSLSGDVLWGMRRYQNPRGEGLDVMYRNIRYAFFQPAENDMITVLHFHLHNPIMIGNKKCKDVQFYAEVRAAVAAGSRLSPLVSSHVGVFVSAAGRSSAEQTQLHGDVCLRGSQGS
jgi:hypothetical protein